MLNFVVYIVFVLFVCFLISSRSFIDTQMKKKDQAKKKRAFIKMVNTNDKEPGQRGTKVIKLNSKTDVKNDGKTHDKAMKNLAEVNSKNCTGANNWERFIGKKIENVQPSKHIQKCDKQKPVQNKKFTKLVAMDCEMVGIGEDGKDSMLARVSIVNQFGDCLYDKFVQAREKVTDYRTHVSGVRECDLVNAETFQVVQKEVADIIKGKILVGHSLKNDMEVLFLSHPRHFIRDTALFFKRKGRGTPSLKNLALEHLEVRIQEGEHSSVQDARAAMQLYNMFRKEWELKGGNKRTARIDVKFEHRNINEYAKDAQDT